MTTDYANPDIPASSSVSDQFFVFRLIILHIVQKSYSYRAHAHSHIYSLEMMIHGAGYPLYKPTPSRGPRVPAGHRKKGVRVGDVGIITANGAFDFLFNACEHDDPSDADVNPIILPDGFELLKLIITVNNEFDPGICLHSTHVDEISDHDSYVLHIMVCRPFSGAYLGLLLFNLQPKVPFSLCLQVPLPTKQ